MENIKRTTEVLSGLSRICEHCGQPIVESNSHSVTDGINHYIEMHGYRLLHLSAHTQPNEGGQPRHGEVAILGHDDPPPLRQANQFNIDFRGLGGP
jgi:hypothetical protein